MTNLLALGTGGLITMLCAAGLLGVRLSASRARTRRLEADIRARDQKLRVFVESCRGYALVMLDAEGRVVDWNDGATSVHGWEAKEIVGKNFARFFTDEDVLGGRPTVALGIAASRGHFAEQGWRVRRDGARYWADVSVTALRDGAGNVTTFALATADGSDRARTEQDRLVLLDRERDAQSEAERLQRRLEELVRTSSALISLHRGPELTYDLVNPAMCEILGEDPTGKAARDVPPLRAGNREWAPLLEEVYRTGVRWTAEETSLHRTSLTGSIPERWFRLIVDPSHDENGAVDGVFSFGIDVTDHVVGRQSVQAAVEARDHFLSVASHELRTPLTSLQLQVQSMLRGARREGRSDDAEQRKLQSIDRHVLRFARLIEQLLDVSKITSGKLELQRERVDLATLVQEMVVRFEADLHRAGCAVTVRSPDSVVGDWDRFRVEQVVANLLSNAIKYGAGTPIVVEVEEAYGVARLRVHDRGIGIEPKDQERIFQRFERAVSDAHYGGLGLGLWIVRQTLEAQGGRISVDSTPGHGTTFTVELPIEPRLDARAARG